MRLPKYTLYRLYSFRKTHSPKLLYNTTAPKLPKPPVRRRARVQIKERMEIDFSKFLIKYDTASRISLKSVLAVRCAASHHHRQTYARVRTLRRSYGLSLSCCQQHQQQQCLNRRQSSTRAVYAQREGSTQSKHETVNSIKLRFFKLIHEFSSGKRAATRRARRREWGRMGAYKYRPENPRRSMNTQKPDVVNLEEHRRRRHESTMMFCVQNWRTRKKSVHQWPKSTIMIMGTCWRYWHLRSEWIVVCVLRWFVDTVPVFVIVFLCGNDEILIQPCLRSMVVIIRPSQTIWHVFVC